MKFELLEGWHHQGGRTYKKGDVVESKSDLTVTFRGKFRRILNSSEQLNSPEFGKPDIPVPTASRCMGGDAASKSPPVISSAKVSSAASSVSTEYGVDVTEEFSVAKILKFKVYCNGERYRVIDPAFGKPLNKKKLTKPQQVEEFLKHYLEG